MSIKLQLGADGKLRKSPEVKAIRRRCGWDGFYCETKSPKTFILESVKELAAGLVLLAGAVGFCWLCHAALTH